MKNIKLKPETQQRIALEHAEKRLAQAWELERKTAEKAEAQTDSGPEYQACRCAFCEFGRKLLREMETV